MKTSEKIDRNPGEGNLVNWREMYLVTEEWKSELARHKSNIQSAAKQIGYDSVKAYDFPDNRFDSVDLLDIVKQAFSL